MLQRMEVHIHTLLTLALGGCEWSVCTSYFTPLGHSPQYVLDSSRTGLGIMQKVNIFAAGNQFPRYAVCGPVTIMNDSPAQATILNLIKMSPIVMAQLQVV